MIDTFLPLVVVRLHLLPAFVFEEHLLPPFKLDNIDNIGRPLLVSTRVPSSNCSAISRKDLKICERPLGIILFTHCNFSVIRQKEDVQQKVLN